MTLISNEEVAIAKKNLYILTHKTNLIDRQNKHTTYSKLSIKRPVLLNNLV